MPEPSVHTTGALARRYRIPEWKVRRVFERGMLPDPGRAGTYRIIRDEDLPALEGALVKAGYLTPAEGAAS